MCIMCVGVESSGVNVCLAGDICFDILCGPETELGKGADREQ